MPFGKYKDMKECIADNQDKDNPGAYCAALHKKLTGKMPTEDMAETGWFEAFQAGKYGDKGDYTLQDLDDMVNGINNKTHVPPVVIGHIDIEDGDSELADGKVIAAKREGDKLLLRVNVSEKHKDLWEDDQLLTWSIRARPKLSIYNNFKDTGKKMLRLLEIKHLAALGKTPPEVKGLNYKPSFSFDEANGQFETFDFASNDNEKNKTMKGQGQMTLEEALKEIERMKAEMADMKKKMKSDMSEDTQAAMLLASEADTKAKAAEQRAKDAESKAAKQLSDLAALKRHADFAEIEKEVQAAHEAKPLALPKTHGDYLRTALAAERGLLKPDGTVEFAEGKSASFSEAAKKLREVKWVPTAPEGKDTSPKKSTTPESGAGAVEAAIAEFAEKNKLDITTAEGYGKAAVAVEKAHPDLFTNAREGRA